MTTNIRADGSRISLHNLGKNQSEKTRKEIETDFGLVKAQDQKAQGHSLQPIRINAEYGTSETKKAIATVLNKVLKGYKFTTIGELNAVLNQFNVVTGTGSPASRSKQVISTSSQHRKTCYRFLKLMRLYVHLKRRG